MTIRDAIAGYAANKMGMTLTSRAVATTDISFTIRSANPGNVYRTAMPIASGTRTVT